MKAMKIVALLVVILLGGYSLFSIATGGSIIGEAFQVEGENNELSGECVDRDGGKNYAVTGQVYNTEEMDVHNDYCLNETTLVEYFCNQQYPDRVFFSCECRQGMCVNPE